MRPRRACTAKCRWYPRASSRSTRCATTWPTARVIPASRAGRASTTRAAPTRAGECWSSRRPNRSHCGAACVPTRARSWKHSLPISRSLRPSPTIGVAKHSPQRHELFRTGGMDRHGVVEVRLGRAHAHRNREALQHFVGADADDVEADDALLRAVRHELHLDALLARRQRVVERAEAGRESLDIAVAGTGLF